MKNGKGTWLHFHMNAHTLSQDWKNACELFNSYVYATYSTSPLTNWLHSRSSHGAFSRAWLTTLMWYGERRSPSTLTPTNPLAFFDPSKFFLRLRGSRQQGIMCTVYILLLLLCVYCECKRLFSWWSLRLNGWELESEDDGEQQSLSSLSHSKTCNST